MIVTEDGGYDSASEEEVQEISEDPTKNGDALQDEEEYDGCTYETGTALVVTKVLSVQVKEDEHP